MRCTTRDPDPQASEIMNTSATTEEKQTKEKLLDLSVPQVVGGALAAVTAAILGSNLGVAGTISGAAAASIITSVSSSLYQRGIERGGQKVRTAIPIGTKPLSQPGGGPTSPVGTRVPPTRPQQRMTHPEPEVTQLMPVAGGPEGSVPPSRKHGRIRWLAVVLGTAAVFAIAMVVVTGFEAVAGQSLGGSERGTSVGQLLGGPPVQVPPDTPQETTEAPTTTAPDTQPTGVPEYGSDSEGTDSPGNDRFGNEDSEPTGNREEGQQDQPEPTGRPRNGPLPGGLIG